MKVILKFSLKLMDGTKSNRIKDGKLVDPNFVYSSDSNSEWLSIKELRAWIENNADKIGVI